MKKEKKKRYYKEGDAVALLEALSQKMIVEKILISSKPVRKFLSDSDKPSFETKKIFHGLKCHWVDNDTHKVEHGQFHKHEIVPWEIAEKGNYISCLTWIEEQKKLK